MNSIEEIESLCADGDTLDGLVKRFEERVAKGMKFGRVLARLQEAKSTLDQRMNLAADVMDSVVAAEIRDASTCPAHAGEGVPHEYRPHSDRCVHCGKPRGA